MRTLKKISALFCAMVLLSLCLTPLAGAETTSQVATRSACGHNNNTLREQDHEITAGRAEGCVQRYRQYFVCNTCGYITDLGTFTRFLPHNRKTLSASCNGKFQTYRRQCQRCDYTWTDSVVCPAGPHSGTCPALSM